MATTDTTAAGAPKGAAQQDIESDPGSLVGAEGKPLREYRGWDEAAKVFRQDGETPRFLREHRAKRQAKTGS